eukprot:4398889-Ditylum_brightwellii.AAC.1
MERNQKLSLEADKAMVLKTFKNKLPTLFGCPISDGSLQQTGWAEDSDSAADWYGGEALQDCHQHEPPPQP